MMASSEQNTAFDYTELTADIVSAYVANNSIPAVELPNLLKLVHSALQGLGSEAKPVEVERPQPPLPIKKTINPDYLISLEDGKRYKSLKRHLAGRDLSPQQYREKWGLPPDYPMVAPNYAKARSELAKKMGLGQQRRKAATMKVSDASVTQSAPAKPKRSRGGKKAAE